MTKDIFEKAAKAHGDKIKKLKVLAFDIDGILTDGRIWWESEEVGWNRAFHAHDGYGLKLMQEAGYKVGVITGGNSSGIYKRFKEGLGLDFVYAGKEDKREAYLEVASMDGGYKDEEIFYMGDELFDVPLLKKAGFSATVPNSSFEVSQVCDYVTTKTSGTGCAREVIDLIRYVCDIAPKVKEFDE